MSSQLVDVTCTEVNKSISIQDAKPESIFYEIHGALSTCGGGGLIGPGGPPIEGAICGLPPAGDEGGGGRTGGPCDCGGGGGVAVIGVPLMGAGPPGGPPGGAPGGGGPPGAPRGFC